jgi:hypothetical protein
METQYIYIKDQLGEILGKILELDRSSNICSIQALALYNKEMKDWITCDSKEDNIYNISLKNAEYKIYDETTVCREFFDILL